jgi:hypothetical protein
MGQQARGNGASRLSRRRGRDPGVRIVDRPEGAAAAANAALGILFGGSMAT